MLHTVRMYHVAETPVSSSSGEVIAHNIDEWLESGAMNLEIAIWLDTKGYINEDVQRNTVLEAFENHKKLYVRNNLLDYCVNKAEIYTEAEIVEINSGFIVFPGACVGRAGLVRSRMHCRQLDDLSWANYWTERSQKNAGRNGSCALHE